MWFGEWSISTNFNATDAFLKDWADAQKLAYSKGAGWIVRIYSPFLFAVHQHILRLSSGASRLKMRVFTRDNGIAYLLLVLIVLVHVKNRRSYLQGLKLGYLTQDPSQYHNPNVCAPYIKNSTATTSEKLAKKQRQRHARENFF